eukprot:Sro487_g152930.1 n/a (451) ;mRNA; f:41328-42680
MDPAAIQALVQAAVAAALLNPAVINAIRPPAAPAPVPVPFSITPAGAGNTPWDFTSANGIKIFMASTAPLSVAYDGNENGLRDFLRKIFQRAESFGWVAILMVNDANGVSRDITTQHGCLKLEDVQAHAITYLRLQQREHQASACLRKLLLGSLVPKLADRLSTRSENYTVNAAAAAQQNQPAPAPIMKEDGTCMLFELIKMVSVDTRATVTIINKRLNNLESVMEEVKSNVEEFNAAVDDLISQLEARSVPVPPMLENLFDGYSNCADLKFVKYIAWKQIAYEDGTIDLDHTELMKIALERYKVLVDRKLWLKKTEQEMEILTLKAEIVELKRPGSSAKKAGAANPGKATPAKGKTDDKYAWKQIAPKDGEAQEKTVGGKEYVFCPHHNTTKWVLKVNDKGIVHRTGCTKMKEAQAGSSAGGKNKTSAAALANAFEGDDEEESDSEEAL